MLRAGTGLANEGFAMPDYRIFYLDEDGKVFARDDLAAESDADAIKRAASIAATRADKGSHYEVWQGDRRVAAVKDSR